MINFGVIVIQNIKEHNPNKPQIPDHSYRILIIGVSRPGKTNVLFNLISPQPDIDKIYLCAKDPYTKYQLLITKRGGLGLNYQNDFKASFEYSK